MVPAHDAAAGQRRDAFDEIAGNHRIILVRIGKIVEPEDFLERLKPLVRIGKREMVQAEVRDQSPLRSPSQPGPQRCGGHPQAEDPRQWCHGLQGEGDPLAGLRQPAGKLSVRTGRLHNQGRFGRQARVEVQVVQPQEDLGPPVPLPERQPPARVPEGPLVLLAAEPW